MKLPHRRHVLHLAAGAAALPATSRYAWAQTYPSRPVRIIAGFPPGGFISTTSQLKALFGWTSDAMPTLYTRAADRERPRGWPHAGERKSNFYSLT